MYSYKCVGLLYDNNICIGYVLCDLFSLKVRTATAAEVTKLAMDDAIANMQYRSSLSFFECSVKRLPCYNRNLQCIKNANMSMIVLQRGGKYAVITPSLSVYTFSREELANLMRTGKITLANGTLTKQGTLRVTCQDAIPVARSVASPKLDIFKFFNSDTRNVENFFKLSKAEFLDTYKGVVTEMQYRQIFAYITKPLAVAEVYGMLTHYTALAYMNNKMSSESPLVLEFGLIRFVVTLKAKDLLNLLVMIGYPMQDFCYGNFDFVVMNNSTSLAMNEAIFKAMAPTWFHYKDKLAAEYAANSRSAAMQPA